MKGWTVVFKSTNNTRTEIVKGVLIDRGIDAVIINKRDSTLHLSHAFNEVLVKKDQVLQAMKIVNDEITFE